MVWSRAPRRQMSSALCLVASLLAALSLVGAPRASAAVGDPFLDSCITLHTDPPCAGAEEAATALAMHPSGRWLYVATILSGGGAYGVTVYDRDTTTGALSRHPGPGGCVTRDGSGGRCGAAPPISAGPVYGMEVSPDGRNLYVPAINGNLVVFDIDKASGALTYRSCFGSGQECTLPRGMGGGYVTGFVVDPTDGTSAYLRVGGALLVFSRDPSTGALTQMAGSAGCLTEAPTSGCTDAVGLTLGGFQLQISPDGRHLYTTEQGPGGVTVFQRLPDGSLLEPAGTAGGCISADGSSNSVAGSCVDGSDTLANAYGVAIDPAGRNVYVTSGTGMVVYARNAVSGLLTEIACYRQNGGGGCGARSGVAAVHAHVTPDGAQLVTSVAGGLMAGFLVRDGAGALTNRPDGRGCLSWDGTSGACMALTPLGSAGISDVALAPDGVFEYLASSPNGMLATLHFDVAPTCEDGAITVTSPMTVEIPLRCVDRNGDRLTRSIVQAPSIGRVEAINDVDGAAVYTAPPYGPPPVSAYAAVPPAYGAPATVYAAPPPGYVVRERILAPTDAYAADYPPRPPAPIPYGGRPRW